MSDLLKPYYDSVFKYIFGREETKDEVLRNFLNETVHETELKPFESLTLLNTTLEKDNHSGKQSILDLRAQNQDGKQINIEIQLQDDKDMHKRTLYYWTNLYRNQLKKGEYYIDLKKTIMINIIDFNFFSNSRFHNVFHLREDHTGEMLTEDIEVHFLELPKVGDQQSDDRLVRWLRFIRGDSLKEELIMNTPGLQKAQEALEYLSHNPEARMAAEKDIIAELNRRSALDRAEKLGIEKGMEKGMEKGIEKGMEKGIEKGMEKGIEKTKLDMARNLLTESDMEISMIAKITRLSEPEIKKLKEQIH